MAENCQDFSSSTSEDDLDSLGSVEEDMVSVGNEIAPHEGEPLASSDDNGDRLEEEEEGDKDGLTAVILERRFEKIEPVSSWCSCKLCNDTTLISAREYRCCREVDCARGKLTFDGSIERISCVTEHGDFLALTNSTVLKQVAPLLRDKNGKSYRRKGGSSEDEFLRAKAYRWLVCWIFSYLGWDNSRPLPACVYNNIRTRYPTHYTKGYASAEQRS